MKEVSETQIREPKTQSQELKFPNMIS